MNLIYKCLLFVTVMLIESVTYGENTMQPLYSLNRALMPVLKPQVYSTNKNKITGIFDVPVDGSVATTEIGNAITLLNFNKHKVSYEVIKRDFLDYVTSTGHMPIFSETLIAYSIGRGFLIFNMKNKQFDYYSIAGHFDYVLSDYDILDPEKRIFVFKIRDRRSLKV